MKNFKKVLALVLTVAMVLSFAVVSTAAFSDAAAIEKTEAVDVLSAIGVINGYEDGSFKPEGTVTRAEMAKMIATIMNQGEDVGTLYAGACTFADTASHWAAGYVAYCAQEGIISGKNASTFAPDETVTGTQAAKMMLAALGHHSDKAGLTGSSWASTTLSLAKKFNLIGFDNNLTANMAAPLSRQDAAQLMLNGLKATMVEYTGGTNIQIGDVTLNQGATASELANTTTTYTTGNVDGKLQLVEQCFPKLKVTAGTADAFGRTCNVWSFEGTDVGSYNTAAYKTYTTAVTLGQLYTDLGKVDASKLSAAATYAVDGVTDNTKAALVNNNLKSGDINEIGGQGVITEVYFDEINMTLNICEINVYAAEILDFVPALKDANGDVSREAYVTLTYLWGGKQGVSTQTDVNGNSIPANAIITDAYTRADKGTVVYYTIGVDTNDSNKAQLMTMAKATAITGSNAGYATVANYGVSSVNIDATTYAVNKNAAASYQGTYGNAETIYVDANNNVVYSTGVGSSDYLYLKDFAGTVSFSDAQQAQVILEDGTVKIVDLAAVHNKGTGLTKDKIYTYVVDGDGKYTLTIAATQNTVAQVTNKVPTLAQNVFADANTTFVVGVKDQVTNVETFTAYTGIAAVPSFTGTTAYAIDPITGNVAAAFVLNAQVTGASTTKVMALYKTGQEATTTAGVNNSYVSVAAVVDGAVTSVKLTPNAYAGLQNGFYLANGGTVDGNGNYASLTPVAASGNYQQAWTFSTFGAYQNGNVTLDSAKYVEASTPVVVWNLSTKKLQVTTVDAVYAMTAQTTGIYTTELSTAQGVAGAITGIYMTVDY